MNTKFKFNLIIYVFLLCCLLPLIVNAEYIEHTHIWTTTYNNSKHWEYCTVCKEIRNEEAHIYTDHWILGYESCTGTNYSDRTCDCGYSYRYTKPHTKPDPIVWRGTGAARGVHYYACTSCGMWMNSQKCHDANGNALSCVNPGTCVKCNTTVTSSHHYLSGNGYCGYCGVKFFERTAGPTVTYSSDYSTATVTFTLAPLYDYVTISGSMSTGYVSTSNWSSATYTHVKNADRSVTYTYTYVFNPSLQRKATIYYGDITGAFYINNVSCYCNTGIAQHDLQQDIVPPVITKVETEDQAFYDDWATIKQLTIEGTENLSNIVYITVKDKLTGKVYLNEAATTVVNGKFTYVCTPPLEAPASGRTYTIQVRDLLRNYSQIYDLTIYQTDGTAPTINENELTVTNWTNTPKKIAVKITDYGSQAPQISYYDQSHYKNCDIYEGTSATSYFIYDKEITGTEVVPFYLKDGLGNATKYTLTTGNIDYTKPIISNVAFTEGNNSSKVTITASDNASGLKSYTVVTPSGKTLTQTSNVFTLTETGNHTIYVTDNAGNNSENKILNVTIIYNLTINANGGTYNNNPQYSTTLRNGNTLTLSTPIRAGHTFTGWTINGTNSSISNNVFKMGTSNTTLTANWSINSYTQTVKVAYENPDGTFTPYSIIESISKVYGTNYSWSLDATTEYQAAKIDEYIVSGDKIHEIKVYRNTVGFDLNSYLDNQIFYSLNGCATADVYINGKLVGNQVNDYCTNHRYGSTYEIKNIVLKPGYTYNGVKSGTLTGTLNGAKSVYLDFSTIPYNITYNLNQGIVSSANPTVYRVNTETFTLNNPTRIGYDFIGWTGSNGTTPSLTVTIAKGTIDDKNYIANFTPRNDTKYVVNHYLEKLDGTYELKQTDNLTGTSDSSLNVNSLVKTFNYFTYNNAKVNNNIVTSTTILADGRRVINLYYTRNSYTVTLSNGVGISSISGSGTYKYNQSVTIKATVKPGYTWKNWSGTNSYLAKDYTFNMPPQNLNLTANATPNPDTKYVVNHYQQNINDNNYTLIETENLTGTTDTSVTPNVKTYTGFTSPAKQTVNIDGDGSRVVNYYYTRNSYTVTLSNGVGISSISGSGTYKYNQSVTIKATIKPGYTWKNWSGTISNNNQTYTFNMPSQNLNLTANATPNPNTKYVVNHYQQNINNNNYTLIETENLTGTTDTLVTPNVKTYIGFTSPAKQTVNIDGDGSRVVNYYYTRNVYTVTYIDIVDNNNGTILSQTTKQKKFEDIISGSELGNDRTQNAYYYNYFYDTCSTITVTTSNNIVYRYFRSCPISTEIKLMEHENIYKVDNVYYILPNKSIIYDLFASSTISSLVDNEYQIDTIELIVQNDGYISQNVEKINTNTEIVENLLTNKLYSSNLFKYDAAFAKRSNYGKTLSLNQKFVILNNFDEVTIYPRSYVTYKGIKYTSDENKDKLLSIKLIADNDLPIININSDNLIDYQLNIQDDTNVNITAFDEISGLKSLEVKIINKDSGETRVLKNSNNYNINISKDDTLFYGNFEIKATAIDNVGNIETSSISTMGFTLDTELQNILTFDNSVFKRGNGCLLNIKTGGYVDRVEVIFSDEMNILNKTYVYNPTLINTNETYEFNIPLYVPEKTYKITIIAYKNGLYLEENYYFQVVSGTILDDFRTRLRFSTN